MSAPVIPVEHRGPMSVAKVRATKQQRDVFCDALIKAEFVLKAQNQHQMEFQRKAQVFKDDWPMRLRIEGEDDQLNIRCWMFIPWSWIGVFALLVLLFLPVASASGVPPLLLLGLGTAVVVFAIAKQKFDLSPKAFWQGRLGSDGTTLCTVCLPTPSVNRYKVANERPQVAAEPRGGL